MVGRCPSAIGVRQAGGWPSGSRACGPRRRSSSASRGRRAGRVRGGEGARSTARRPRRPQARGPVPTRAGHGRHRRGRRALDQRGRPSPGRRHRPELAEVKAREQAELERRARRPGCRPPRRRRGPDAVVVDDGLATGARRVRPARWPGPGRRQGRARGAGGATRDGGRCGPRRRRRRLPWRLRSRSSPSVGWYADFSPTSDQEVVDLLTLAGEDPKIVGAVSGVDKEVEVPAERRHLPGHLTIPSGATGLVVFAHGSGSGRHSPRNQAVARALNDAGLGTLLFDLLSPDEESDRANVFDIPLLAGRLGAATAWLRDEADAGASADRLLRRQHRGGRGVVGGRRAGLARAGDRVSWWPARPGSCAPRVGPRAHAPDRGRTRRGRPRDEPRCGPPSDQRAPDRGRPGREHLFEEPGALEAVADLAARWFLEHLAGTRP